MFRVNDWFPRQVDTPQIAFILRLLGKKHIIHLTHLVKSSSPMCVSLRIIADPSDWWLHHQYGHHPHPLQRREVYDPWDSNRH